MNNTANNAHIYVERRKNLISLIKREYPSVEQGLIILLGKFEESKYPFRQDSDVYYLTGLKEPGIIVTMSLQDAYTTMYMPDFGGERHKWMNVEVDYTTAPASVGLDAIKPLGKLVRGYSLSPWSEALAYEYCFQDIKHVLEKGASIFIIARKEDALVDRAPLWQLMFNQMPAMAERVISITSLVDSLRRKKSKEELVAIQKAIDITTEAQKQAARFIRPGLFEYQVQAEIEAVFTRNNARFRAFPSIVGAGKNSTVLHYVNNDAQMNAGDLVVIDIGAEYDYYAADLTRTYPVSGKFSKDQQDVYQLVLHAQQWIAQAAKPGMYLSNAEAKDQSLHHLSVEFFKKLGMDRYFPHGIGHFMGLDVHDVGNVKIPLDVGDVFTIEPGLYIREKNIGIRIEDDFLMTEQGAVALSDALGKDISVVEELMEK